jgi:predicted PolB exonuclease-like 3'-5' exonuclease
MTIVFDLETGPQPNAKDFLPVFKAPSRWNDPEKIEAARVKHEEECLEDAALDPLTAQILTIAYRRVGKDASTILCFDEKQNLEVFWEEVEEEDFTTLAGFCSENFDLPMLFARSWVHGIKPLAHFRRGRYFTEYSVDLQRVWLCGRTKTEGVSLDRVCRALGLPGKANNGVTGGNFAAMYATDREKAIEYALQDIESTYRLFEKLCL